MPLVAYSVEGNGHLLVNPSGAHVPENTVVTVEAVPYTGESIIYVEFYEEIKTVNTNLPNKLEEAYKILKPEFNSKIKLFEKIFGSCTLNVNKNKITISNIKPNYKNRNTISLDQIYFLITLVFCSLEKIRR